MVDVVSRVEGVVVVCCLLLKEGKGRKGKERKGKERKGKERKGKERKVLLWEICELIFDFRKGRAKRSE
jgi:hypothetical protein